jgi:hypothetical protein
MHKAWYIALIVAIVFLVSAGVRFGLDVASAAEASITEDEAKDIAEAYTDGTAAWVEYEDDEEGPMYEVHIENATGNWEVEVDGDTGEISEIEEDDEGEDDDDAGERFMEDSIGGIPIFFWVPLIGVIALATIMSVIHLREKREADADQPEPASS